MDIPKPRYNAANPSILTVVMGAVNNLSPSVKQVEKNLPMMDYRACLPPMHPFCTRKKTKGHRMSSPCNENAEKQALAGLDCEALLQVEISFWQEVIATCPATQCGESLERMHQALALAESKLAMLNGTAGAAGFSINRKH
jgi:hypothetical protein